MEIILQFAENDVSCAIIDGCRVDIILDLL